MGGRKGSFFPCTWTWFLQSVCDWSAFVSSVLNGSGSHDFMQSEMRAKTFSPHTCKPLKYAEQQRKKESDTLWLTTKLSQQAWFKSSLRKRERKRHFSPHPLLPVYIFIDLISCFIYRILMESVKCKRCWNTDQLFLSNTRFCQCAQAACYISYECGKQTRKNTTMNALKVLKCFGWISFVLWSLTLFQMDNQAWVWRLTQEVIPLRCSIAPRAYTWRWRAEARKEARSTYMICLQC